MRRRRESRALTGGPSGPRTRARQRANKHSAKPSGTTEHPIPATITPALPNNPATPESSRERPSASAHPPPQATPTTEHRPPNTVTPLALGAVLGVGTEPPPPRSQCGNLAPTFTAHPHLSRADPRAKPYATSSCQRRHQRTSSADLRPPTFRTRLIPGPETPRLPPTPNPTRPPWPLLNNRTNCHQEELKPHNSPSDTNAQYRTESANCRAAIGLPLLGTDNGRANPARRE